MRANVELVARYLGPSWQDYRKLANVAALQVSLNRQKRMPHLVITLGASKKARVSPCSRLAIRWFYGHAEGERQQVSGDAKRVELALNA